MASGGYIQLWRSMVEWEWYKNSNTKAVFIHLLLKANHADARWQGTDIKAGQLVTSSDGLAKELGLTRQNVRTALVHLKSTNEITIQSTNKFMLITLENWASYQIGKQESTSKSTSEPTNDQPATNQQLTTNNKNKKKEKKKNINNAVFEDSDSGDVVIDFPMADGTTVWIKRDFANEMQKLYPTVDVRDKLFKMKAWLIANPAKRKTRQRASVFINNWLSKCPSEGRTYDEIKPKPRFEEPPTFPDDPNEIPQYRSFDLMEFAKQFKE